MAAVLSGEIKSLLTIKSKSRNDNIIDQYSRIFMVKLFLVCTIIMGVSWYSDGINCIVPESTGIETDFVSSACWIQGMYVYKELANNADRGSYFGMPRNMDDDGMLEASGELCTVKPKLGAKRNENCKPMTKTFFLQYQWMPFMIATLACVYYVPYVAFIFVNSDLNRLKDAMKKSENTSTDIVKHFFNNKPHRNTSRMLLARVLLNVAVKMLYLVSNTIAFLGLDSLLNNEFKSYGGKWIRWARLNNHVAYDYMGMRDFPKPGNLLLPPFGYCEMYESARDVKTTITNRHKFVCELSQHILYQYCLFVLWVAIVFGIFVTAIGLLQLLLHYAFFIIGVGRRSKDSAEKKMCKHLTFRENEYLDFIQRKNTVLFEEVMDILKAGQRDASAPEEIPLYPALPPKPNKPSF